MDKTKEIRNINTLANDIHREFFNYVEQSQKLDIHVSGDYRNGFTDGVKALSTRFLKAMEAQELAYTRKP